MSTCQHCQGVRGVQWLSYKVLDLKLKGHWFEPYPGFALGLIFLSPPFSPIRFFCAIFLNLEPDF